MITCNQHLCIIWDDPISISGDTHGNGVEDNPISGTISVIDNADGVLDGTLFEVTTDPLHGNLNIHILNSQQSFFYVIFLYQPVWLCYVLNPKCYFVIAEVLDKYIEATKAIFFSNFKIF